jgi:hypothetical protein
MLRHRRRRNNFVLTLPQLPLYTVGGNYVIALPRAGTENNIKHYKQRSGKESNANHHHVLRTKVIGYELRVGLPPNVHLRKVLHRNCFFY